MPTLLYILSSSSSDLLEMNQLPITYSDFTGDATDINSDPRVDVIISIVATLFILGFFCISILITVVAVRVCRRRRSTQRNRSELCLDSGVTVCNADTDQMQDDLEPGIMHLYSELNNKPEIQHLAPVTLSNGNPTYSAMEPDVIGHQILPYLGVGSHIMHNSGTLPATGLKDAYVPQCRSTRPKLYHSLRAYHCPERLSGNVLIYALPVNNRTALVLESRNISKAHIARPRADASTKYPHPQQVLDNQLHCHSYYHQRERVGAGIDCDHQCSSIGDTEAQCEARLTCTVDSSFISAIDTPSPYVYLLRQRSQSAYNSSLLPQRQRVSQYSISSMNDSGMSLRVIRGGEIL